jgi:hypothetical protein
MAIQVLNAAQILVGSFDCTGFTGKVTTDPAQANVVSVPTFASGGYDVNIASTQRYEVKLEGYSDFSATGINTAFVPSTLGSQTAVAICPTGGTTAGDPAFGVRGLISRIVPLQGGPDTAAAFMLDVTSDWAEYGGQVAAPLAARSTALTGSALTLTGPTASQSVWASLHVTATTGTNLVVKVQSSSTVGFASPTDRITFSTMSATGWQFKNLAGPITDGYWRVTATVGSGSFTFAALIGVE